MSDLSFKKKEEKRGNLAFINTCMRTYTQYIHMYTQFQERELAEEISQWLTGCSSREKFESQYPYSSLQWSIIPIPEDMTSFSGFPGHQAHLFCTDIHVGYTPIHTQ